MVCCRGMRIWVQIVGVVAVALAGVSLVDAQDARSAKQVCQTYPVGDLVVPDPRVGPGPAQKKDDPLQENLILLITSTIRPMTWASQGGQGTIEYFPLTMALVIHQTLDVQEQIIALLKDLRAIQSKQVALELHILSVGEEMADRLQEEYGINCARCKKCDDLSEEPQFTGLRNREVIQLLQLIQSDPKANVLQAPRLIVVNGKKAAFQTQENRYFVTGIDVSVQDGKPIFQPRNERATLGLEFSALPVVSADEKYVRIQLDLKQKSLAASEVELVPLATTIPGKNADGSEAKPVQFTQFLQAPRYNEWKVNRTMVIPNGGTMVLSGWTMDEECTHEEGMPILEDLPYVGELFKESVKKHERRCMLLMVTPRVMKVEQGDPAFAEMPCPHEWHPITPPPVIAPTYSWQPPQPCQGIRLASHEEPAPTEPEQVTKKDNGKKVAALVRKYQKACREGRTEEAGKIGRKALRLDPTCFTKQD